MVIPQGTPNPIVTPYDGALVLKFNCVKSIYYNGPRLKVRELRAVNREMQNCCFMAITIRPNVSANVPTRLTNGRRSRLQGQNCPNFPV